MLKAKERADQFGVKHILVATNTGTSVRRADAIFGTGYRLYAVGNPASAHGRGLVLHEGITEQTREVLEGMGISVVQADRTLFQRPDLSLIGASWSEVQAGVSPEGRANALSVAYSVLQWLGDGPRVCIEIALLAADAGVLPLDEDCLAIACPSSYCDLPDAAVVLRPTRSEDVLSGELRIKNIFVCPTPDDVWFSNGPLP